MIRYYYIDPAGDLVEFTDRVKIPGLEVTWSAEQCAVAASSMMVENPLGDFPMGGHRLILVEEDTADFPRVWTGYSANRKWERGEFYRTGPTAVIEVSLVDANSIIGRLIITGSDGNRPAETDVARMQWLQSTYTWVIGDDAALSTANPVNMDASDYRGQSLLNVVQDCMDQSGKNAFNYDEDGSHGVYGGGIFYDFASSTTLTSDLRISNDMDDVDEATTWYASLDTNLVRDPSRVYGGVYGNFDGGHVYRTRPATTTAFAMGGRDTSTSWPNVKTTATANARADRYLLDISTEEDIITTTIEVPAANVNDARAGFRIECRFTHLSPPDYDSFVWMRILDRTVKQLTPDRFAITYTLSPGSIATPAGTCTTVAAGLEMFDFGQVGGAGSHLSNADTFVPGTPSVYPSVVISALAMQNGAGSFSSPVTGVGPTQMGRSRPTNVGAVATAIETGYEALAAGAPTTFVASWSSGQIEAYRGISIAIPTAATSPVQQADQMVSGHIITLPAPPTPGNILVIISYAETSPFALPPVGWSSVGSVAITTSAAGVSTIAIYVRCVQAGDSATIIASDNSFSHWQFCSEWAIT